MKNRDMAECLKDIVQTWCQHESLCECAEQCDDEFYAACLRRAAAMRCGDAEAADAATEECMRLREKCQNVRPPSQQLLGRRPARRRRDSRLPSPRQVKSELVTTATKREYLRCVINKFLGEET
jgi:hypothetical protein